MAKLKFRSPITVVISLEGLATSPLGCYGCSWNQTPAVDGVAATGIVFDRWTSPTDQLGGLANSWLVDSQQVVSRYAKLGGAVFLTDDHQMEIEQATAAFTSRRRLEVMDSRIPAETPDSTAIAKVFHSVLDCVDEKTRLVWLHSGILRDCWDAPIDPETEDDQPVEPIEHEIDRPSTATAGPVVLPVNTTPPSYKVSTDDDPDLLFAWMNRYAAQVRQVDRMLASLMMSLESRRPRIVVAGTSGFSLGENGWVGHHVGPLRSQDIRLPMIVSGGGPVRVPGVRSASDMSSVLEDLVDRRPVISPASWCESDTAFEPLVETQSDRASRALTTPTWFYVNDQTETSVGAENLFLKPDDINDANDISRLRRDVMDQLSGQ